MPRATPFCATIMKMNKLIRVSLVGMVLTFPFAAEHTLAEPLPEEPPSMVASAMVDSIELWQLPGNHVGLSTPVPGKSVHDLEEEKKAAEAAAKRKAQASVRTSKKPSTPVVVADNAEILAYARTRAAEIWGDSQWAALFELGMKESGWNPKAQNRSSGACGIPQAHPCSKMPQGVNTPWREQVEWFLNYVKARYKTPTAALHFWKHIAPTINGHHWY